MKTNLNLSPATAFAVTLERHGIAPIASLQGSGLSFAGAYGASTAAAKAPAQHGMTLGTATFTPTFNPAKVVRTDDARVPEPRGRKR